MEEDRAAAMEGSAWRPRELPQEQGPVSQVEYDDPEISPWAPKNVTDKEGKGQATQPDPSGEQEMPQQASAEQRPEQAEKAPPEIDLPNDQEAAALAAQREAEEKEAQQLLAGRSLDPEEPTEAVAPPAAGESVAHSQANAMTPEGTPRQDQPEEKPLPQAKADPEEKPKETPVVEEQNLNANNMTIRSPGFLATLAQGFIQGHEERLSSKERQAAAKRQDAARAKYLDFTQAAHELERQSEAVLRHPVMDAVRQAAPDGLAKATDAQRQLVSSIVQSNPDFQRQLDSLQNGYDALVSKFDALSPDLEQIPAKERQAYGQIADRHLKKIEKNLQEIPDKKGSVIWQRLKESFRAIGQRLGLIAPDSVLQQVTVPGPQSAPSMAPRAGRR
jgi:hypothetical protein